jgi:hypothetical protein
MYRFVQNREGVVRGVGDDGPTLGVEVVEYLDVPRDDLQRRVLDLGSGRTAGSDTAAPNMLANLVYSR